MGLSGVRALSLGLVLLPLAACQQSKSTASSVKELHQPHAVASNGTTVPGCCSLDTRGWSVKQNLSDSYSLSLSTESARADLSFGPYDRSCALESGQATVIDGVDVRSLRSGEGGRSRQLAASVPPSGIGEANGLRPYTFNLTGHCASERGCESLDRLFASLRF